MTVVPVFYGRVDAGGVMRVPPTEKARQARYLESISDSDIEYVIRKRRSKRSHKQLKWIRGVAVPLLGMELGYDKDELDDLHYALLVECFGTHVDKMSGKEIPNVQHTGDLNTKETAEYMEWLVRFAAKKFGVVIPLPNEAE